MKRPLHLVFVCIGNRNRSPFAEFFFSKLLSERDNKLTDKINITSAGFLPQRMKDKMAALKIVAPNPFFGRSLPQTTRTSLLRHGIIVSEAWRSKELTRELAEQADLIITVLPDQKEDIKRIYPNIASRIITIREISQWEDYLLQEDYDFKKIPRDNTLWNYVEEDSEYVATILLEMEKMLIKAYPSIIAKLGFKINGGEITYTRVARQQ